MQASLLFIPWKIIRNFFLIIFFSTIFFVFSAQAVSADTHTWDGGGADNNWSTCANWDVSDTCPAVGDTVTFNATSTKNSTIDALFGGTIAVVNINAGYSGTITQSRPLTVSGAFTQSAGTFQGGSTSVNHNGAVTLNAGADYNATSGTTTVTNVNFTIANNAGSGAFDPNGGTFVFTGGTAVVLNVDNNNSERGVAVYDEEFYNLTINKSNNISQNIESGRAILVSGVLNLTNGLLNVDYGGAIYTFGDVVFGGDFDGGGSGTVYVNNSGTVQTVTVNKANSADSNSCILDINNSSAIINAAGVGTAVFGNITLRNGTINQGSTAIEFAGTYSQSGGTFNGGSNTLTTTGAFNLSGGTFNDSITSTVHNGSFTQSGGTYNGVGTVDHNNTLTLNSGATYIASSGTTYATSATFTIAEGASNGVNTFQHNNGSFVFDGGTAVIFNPDSTVSERSVAAYDEEFYDLTINKSNNIEQNITAGHSIVVSRILTLTNGTINTGIIYTLGDTTIGGAFDGGLGTVYVSNEGTVQTVTANAGTGVDSNANVFVINNSLAVVNAAGSAAYPATFGDFTLQNGTFNQNSTAVKFQAAYVQSGGTFNGGNATLDFDNSFTISGDTALFTATSGSMTVLGSWTHTGGAIFSHNNGTVTFDQSGAATSTYNFNVSETFYNFTVSGAESTSILSISSGDTLITTNLLTLTNGTVNTGTLEAQGSVTLNSGFDGGSSPLTFTSGGGTRYLTVNASASSVFNSDITINKTAGTYVQLTSNALTLNAASQDLIITSGVFNTSGLNLTVNGTSSTLAVGANGALCLFGNETITTLAGQPTFASGSTMRYAGIAGPYTMKDWVYNNTTLDISPYDGVTQTNFTLPNHKFFAGASIGPAGVLVTDGRNLTVTGSFSNNGTLKVRGNEIVSLTNDTDSGTVLFVGDTDAAADVYTITNLSSSFYNLTITSGDGATDTFQLGADIDINNNFTLTAGTFDVSVDNRAMTIGGNFYNTGTFTARAGTVTFDDATKTSVISGSTSFYGLRSVTPDKNIQFTASSTQTVTGALTLTGSADHLIVLRSTSDGTRWGLTLSGTQDLSYVDVKDSDASGGTLISSVYSTNSLNNLNWSFSAEVGWSVASQSASEGVETIIITAQLSLSVDVDVIVPYAITGTATGGGTDYSITASPITITAGNTTADITVTVVNDSTDEASETVIVTMGEPTNAIQGVTTVHTATINDNDEAPALSVSDISVSEADGTATVTVTMTGTSSSSVSVDYATSNNTATAGSDYTSTSGTLTWTAGQTGDKTFNVSVTNDVLDENSEIINITLSNAVNGTVSDGSGLLAIQDNDNPPTVSFTTSSQSASEGAGTMTVTAELSAASGLDVTVPYTITGTATGSGTDYSITASPITAGNTTADITITITNDTLDESDETVIVTMGEPTNATQGATTVHTATIEDSDDPPTVVFTASSQSAAESAGTMTVTAQLSAASGLDVTVPFTFSGTATLVDDYTATVSPITITAGSTTAAITITIVNDIFDENNETVVVSMGIPTNATRGATIVHTATVSDDEDPPTVAWTIGSQSASEGAGTMTVTATLSEVSNLDVTIPYTMTGTATGSGTDYSITASPITITAGNLTSTITITLVDDAIEESSETVIVTMGEPTNATQGVTTVHTATVNDNDDAPTVIVTSTSQSQAESAGTATVTVQIDAVSGQNVIIPFTLSGTATGSGTDYSVTASPITITAGNTTATITYTITDDTKDENDETAIVTLGAPTNATLGTDTVHTLTITDNDNPPTVSFTTSSQSASEGAGTMTVTAELSRVSALDVTIPYTITGTATGSGTDYSITASPITITAGNTTADITITMTNDVLDESNETVIVTMGEPTNAIQGATTVHTATINDNDDASRSRTDLLEKEDYSVSFLSPVDSERVTRNTTKIIRWSSTGDIRFVNLYYSLNRGMSYQLIKKNLENIGSYVWAVPDKVDDGVILKVEATDLADILVLDIVRFAIVDAVSIEEEVDIASMPLEKVFAETWMGDLEKRGLYEVFVNFPSSIAIGDLVKLPDDGDMDTQYDSAVYYIGSDHRRHPFPNEAVYKSWFADFSSISIVDAQVMAHIPLGPFVTFSPGSVLVKFPSIPRVYSVDVDGGLRWLTSESLAMDVYGSNWSKMIQDVSEAFWSSYRFY